MGWCILKVTRDRSEDLLPYGYQHNPVHEHLGMAIAKATGQCAVDILMIGVPKTTTSL